jgi:3D (Asp-Asp-Asp) domain-containing protein
LALTHFLLLTELQAKADETAAPEPRVIEVGESERDKAERLRRQREEEAKREKEARINNRNSIRSSRNNHDDNLTSNGRNHNNEWITFEATAYTAFCDTGCTGVTKTGLDVSNTTTHGGRTIIAVDPAVIPLGSAVEIRLADGRVIAGTAQDTGGAIRGKRIDVLMSSEGQEREFGRQSVKIKVMGAE